MDTTRKQRGFLIMATLDRNDNNEQPTNDYGVSKLSFEAQIGLQMILRPLKLTRSESVDENGKPVKGTGYVRIKESELDKYEDMVKAAITQLYVLNKNQQNIFGQLIKDTKL